ncbi:MAG: shikimate dehydrogenase [Actinomycetota bacterium]
MSERPSGTTRSRAAVLGSPIAHSLSPVLHHAAYAATGLDWDYSAIECDTASLPALLERVRSEPGWRGLSLTMPLKIAAVPLVDVVDSDVELVGALNTIVVAQQGDEAAQLVGHNTDVYGITAAIPETGIRDVESALVLGAGGTARAAIAALAGVGVRFVVVVARDVSRVDPLVRLGERIGVDVEGAPWSSVREQLSSAEFVIATTPAGATDFLATARFWPHGVPLLDVLYDPWPTELARYAASRGAPVVGGLSVLTHQAAQAFELMTGLSAPVEDMRTAGEQVLAGRRNAAT